MAEAQVESVPPVTNIAKTAPQLSVITQSVEFIRVYVQFDVQVEGENMESVVFEIYLKKDQNLFKKEEFEIEEIAEKGFYRLGIPNRDCYVVACCAFSNGIRSAYSKKLEVLVMKKDTFYDLFKSEELVIQKRDEIKQKIMSLDASSFFSLILNVLLLGAMGTGKSSFLNTLNSIFNSKYGQPIAQTSFQTTTVTKELSRYEIVNGKKDLNVLDFYGETNDNYQQILTLLMGGFLDEGHTEGDETPQRNKDQIKIEDIPHVVMIFVSANSATSPDTIKRVKSLTSKLCTLSVDFVIVLTKIDSEESLNTTLHDLPDIYSNHAIYSLIKGLSERIGVSTDNIFPVMNYCEISETSPYLEVLALRALYSAINKSNIAIKNFLKKNRKDSPSTSASSSKLIDPPPYNNEPMEKWKNQQVLKWLEEQNINSSITDLANSLSWTGLTLIRYSKENKEDLMEEISNMDQDKEIKSTHLKDFISLLKTLNK